MNPASGLSSARAPHPDMPDVPGAMPRRIQTDDSGRLCVFGMVEQFQSNAAGVTAEQGEIDPRSFFLSY